MNENIRIKFDALVGAITSDIKQRIISTFSDAEVVPYEAPCVTVVSARAMAKASPKKTAKVAASKPETKDVAEKFLAHVRKNPGLRAEQVMEAIGQSENSRRLMPQIRAELGTQVKTKGQRRGTTYFVKGA